MEKPQEKSVVRPGIWSMKVRGNQKTVLLLNDKNRYGFAVGGPRDVISWEAILQAGPGCEVIMPYMVWREDIELGEDITEEFLADTEKLRLLAERQPDMFDIILTERSELTVPLRVIKGWNGSNDRNLRILSIKFLSRVDKHELEKPAGASGRAVV